MIMLQLVGTPANGRSSAIVRTGARGREEKDKEKKVATNM